MGVEGVAHRSTGVVSEVVFHFWLDPSTQNFKFAIEDANASSSLILHLFHNFICFHMNSSSKLHPKKSLHRLPPFQSLQGAALRNVFQNAWSRDISSSSNACRLERIGRRMHPWLFSMLIGLTWADLFFAKKGLKRRKCKMTSRKKLGKCVWMM